MSLETVDLSHDALLCVTSHALSTEQQEVMGLLLGSWRYDDQGTARVAEVCEAYPLSRTDKRPDRVEVSSEQLAVMVTLAEERGLKVIGWYHSHPHITAAPSHVDARTQGQFQSLDQGFAGLICAVFQQRDETIWPSIKIVAFQSDNSAHEPGGFVGAGLEPPTYDQVVYRKVWRPRELPVHVHRRTGGLTPALRALAQLQDALFQEEVAARSASNSLFADAVFKKGVASVANAALHPLIHVVQAKLHAQTERRDRARAKLAALREGLP